MAAQRLTISDSSKLEGVQKSEKRPLTSCSACRKQLFFKVAHSKQEECPTFPN